MIHPTAIVSPDAIIGEGCEIGAYAYIGENVKLGNNVKIMAHAYLEHCEIGSGTSISPFASIGTAPQDLGYKNEPTKAYIGENCIIKEYATVNRGAVGDGDCTRVGNRCLLMTSSHVAHRIRTALFHPHRGALRCHGRRGVRIRHVRRCAVRARQFPRRTRSGGKKTHRLRPTPLLPVYQAPALTQMPDIDKNFPNSGGTSWNSKPKRNTLPPRAAESFSSSVSLWLRSVSLLWQSRPS